MPLLGFIDLDGKNIPFDQLEKGRFSYPLPLLKAAAKQKTPYCDISASEIANGLPRQAALKARHEYFEEVDDSFFALVGNGIHSLLDQHAEKNSLHEEKLVIQVDEISVGGTPDYYPDGKLIDWKSSNVYSAKLILKNGAEKEKPEFIKQLSIYNLLLHLHGFEVKEAEICFIVRDWRNYEAERTKAPYPPKVFTIPIRPMSFDETNKLVEEAVAEFKCCLSIPDNELPYCPTTLLWERNGERLRCSKYCQVSAFCSQYAEYLMAKKSEVA